MAGASKSDEKKPGVVTHRRIFSTLNKPMQVKLKNGNVAVIPAMAKSNPVRVADLPDVLPTGVSAVDVAPKDKE